MKYILVGLSQIIDMDFSYTIQLRLYDTNTDYPDLSLDYYTGVYGRDTSLQG